ncbi:MAG TPA: hypothetical protein VIF09_29230 [Polyangiaceae bacterium]
MNAASVAGAVCARVVHLATPPVQRLVPADVFDAFGWCASDVLEWRCPDGPRYRWDASGRIDGSDPARMVFVLRGSPEGDPAPFLPRELARLHAFDLGLGEEQALAPWAIDDATDGLHAHGIRPASALWVAADNLNALFWALHDWAHFHNHGPFEERALTELQCDASALVWLWQNRALVPLDDGAWEDTRRDVVSLCAGRFASEGKAFDPSVLDASSLRRLGGS